jgi:iron complex outermembrane recepter protein
VKKFLLVAFTAIFIPFISWAQFSLGGKIADKETGKALIGASIRLINPGYSIQSNADGVYAFNGLQKGSYRIQVSFLGFKSVEKEITLTGNMELNISLTQSNLLAEEVIVSATRASQNSASTYQNISKAELEKSNLGQDLPFLLNQTVSTVITSDAGAGIGYTGIRIRGSDATRMNVTINGIPYNDSESQGTFLVDLPDMASSVDNIQIQRGVGTSTNGAGAFGASINIQTITRKDSAYAELNNTYGSFNSWKNTVNLGSGLINNQFSVDGRLSQIRSDGYIDRASSNLKSYFVSGAYYGPKSIIRANIFSGKEKTYQAWNGVPQNLLSSNRTYNGFTYENQNDNYTQTNYQLLYSQNLSPLLSLNGALHYTKGRGHYEEFKEDQSLGSYGISSFISNGDTIENSNLARRRWLDNDFYGATYSVNYHPVTNLKFTLGGAYNEYEGKHFGEVISTPYPQIATGNHYYDGTGFKADFNIFGKTDWQIGKISLFADLQYRRITYKIGGTDKNRNALNQQDLLGFFNPKIGLTYYVNDLSNVYVSFAVANKEPNRDDYINSKSASRPKSENLQNIEAGYRVTGRKFNAGINGFAMFYKDQLVLTGKINDVGEYIRQNVPDSYRLGIEASEKWQISRKFAWSVNAALSTNKVKNFTEYVDDYDNGGQLVNNYRNTDLAFSPSFVSSSDFSVNPFRKTEIALLSKYVSKQYLDNTSNSKRSIDAFFVNDLRVSYNTSFKRLKNIGLTLLANNIFAELYESNGYTFSYLYNGSFTTENYYFPQAKRNFLLSLNVKF